MKRKYDMFYIGFVIFCAVMAVLFLITYFQIRVLKEQSEKTLSSAIAAVEGRKEIEDKLYARMDEIIEKYEANEADCTEDAITKQLGEFKVMVYTPYCDGGRWGYSTATGIKSEHLKTCAVDPEIIEPLSSIDVGGLKLIAADTGSAVKGKVIDIFFDGTKKEAYDWLDEFGTVKKVEVL